MVLIAKTFITVMNMELHSTYLIYLGRDDCTQILEDNVVIADEAIHST